MKHVLGCLSIPVLLTLSLISPAASAGAVSAADCDNARSELRAAAKLTSQLLGVVKADRDMLARLKGRRGQLERTLQWIDRAQAHFRKAVLFAASNAELNSGETAARDYQYYIDYYERLRAHYRAEQDYTERRIQDLERFFATEAKTLLEYDAKLPALELQFDNACRRAALSGGTAGGSLPNRPTRPAALASPAPPAPPLAGDALTLTLRAGGASLAARVVDGAQSGPSTTRGKAGESMAISASVNGPLAPYWKLQLTHSGPGGKTDCDTSGSSCSATITLPRNWGGITVVGKILKYDPPAHAGDPPIYRGSLDTAITVDLSE